MMGQSSSLEILPLSSNFIPSPVVSDSVRAEILSKTSIPEVIFAKVAYLPSRYDASLKSSTSEEASEL